jgi:transketolase
MKKIRHDKTKDLKTKALWVRRQILKMACGAGAGHISSSFSCTEILLALYQGGILRVNPKDPGWEKRDRFILSKGHGALALYAVLADMGFFPAEELSTFAKEGSRLGGHAEAHVPGIDILSGSLGHGLSIGCGLSLCARLDKKDFLTIVLLGDGECHEGSIWEAAMFAGQHRLGNLIAIVDNNGISASDHLDRYLTLKPLDKKWSSFGWKVVRVDGHSVPQILKAFSGVRNRKGNAPLLIIADTVKGKGISFIENDPDWHFRVPVGKELKAALSELGMRTMNGVIE